MTYADRINNNEFIIMFSGKKKFINKAINEIKIRAKISWYENTTELFSLLLKKKDPNGVNRKTTRNEYIYS